MADFVIEKKMTAHHLDETRALAIITHFCTPDPVYAAGIVNSIYFDTPHLAAFREKIEGDTLKRKYRLRWYDVPDQPDGDQTPAFLEIKYRYGAVRDKLRLRTMLPSAWLRSVSPVAPDLGCRLRELALSHDDNIPLDLFPMLCISYFRRRFRCLMTGITVCMDSAIRAHRINPRFFPESSPFQLHAMVCEYKAARIPEVPWLRQLYHAGFRLRSFSKYGECINQIQHGCAPTVIPMSI